MGKKVIAVWNKCKEHNGCLLWLTFVADGGLSKSNEDPDPLGVYEFTNHVCAFVSRTSPISAGAPMRQGNQSPQPLETIIVVLPR